MIAVVNVRPEAIEVLLRPLLVLANVLGAEFGVCVYQMLLYLVLDLEQIIVEDVLVAVLKNIPDGIPVVFGVVLWVRLLKFEMIPAPDPLRNPVRVREKIEIETLASPRTDLIPSGVEFPLTEAPSEPDVEGGQSHRA